MIKTVAIVAENSSPRLFGTVKFAELRHDELERQNTHFRATARPCEVNGMKKIR